MTEHPTDARAIVQRHRPPEIMLFQGREMMPVAGAIAAVTEALAMNAARTTPIDDEGLTRIPSPKQIAAAWSVIDAGKGGIKNLGPGLGVREIWEAMFDAGSNVS